MSPLSLVEGTEGRGGSPSPVPPTAAPLPFDSLAECMQRAVRGHLPSAERHAVVAALQGRGGGGGGGLREGGGRAGTAARAD